MIVSHPYFKYVGIDTVRFRVNIPDLLIIDDNEMELPTGRIISPAGYVFEHSRIVEAQYIFEFSAHAYYGWSDCSLADVSFLHELERDYGAQFLRIDLAGQVRDNKSPTLERLSYCRYYGRRSLQKKKEPWAYWPSQKKTVKFYDKAKEQVKKNGLMGSSESIYARALSSPESSVLDPSILGCKLRFEIEYRGESGAIPQVYQSHVLDYSSFFNTFDHIVSQCQHQQEPLILTRAHYAVIGMLSCNVPISSYRDRKLLPDLERLGLLND